MAVYVDPLMPCVRTRRWPWPAACHLFADSVGELHQFASRIGLPRAWFQTGHRDDFPHYDLVESKRCRAVAVGAIEVTLREMLAKIKERDE